MDFTIEVAIIIAQTFVSVLMQNLPQKLDQEHHSLPTTAWAGYNPHLYSSESSLASSTLVESNSIQQRHCYRQNACHTAGARMVCNVLCSTKVRCPADRLAGLQGLLAKTQSVNTCLPPHQLLATIQWLLAQLLRAKPKRVNLYKQLQSSTNH